MMTIERRELFATNAVAMNTQYGDEQFPIHSLAERQDLQPGAFVKVEISWPTDQTGCSGERFWVIVLERRAGRYLGIVDNDLLGLSEVSRGVLIQFGPEHVLDIETAQIDKSPSLIMFNDVVDVVSGSPDESL